jgi:hypothetical protein
MRSATEDPLEYKNCMLDFEHREKKFYDPNALSKRRKKVLGCGEGRYIDSAVNMRWMTWRACWDWLRS